VITITDREKDVMVTIFMAIGIILTSLAWIGDIASWAYVGNGFTIDFILLLLAIVLTVILFLFIRNIRQKEKKSAKNLPSDEKTESNSLDGIIDNDKPSKRASPNQDQKLTATEGRFSVDEPVITCATCGEILVYDQDCVVCGAKKPVCIVCLSPLLKEDTIVKVTCCQSYAHKEHIENWLKVKQTCPKCHAKITLNQIEEVHYAIF
jgi:hypothetical protein